MLRTAKYKFIGISAHWIFIQIIAFCVTEMLKLTEFITRKQWLIHQFKWQINNWMTILWKESVFRFILRRYNNAKFSPQAKVHISFVFQYKILPRVTFSHRLQVSHNFLYFLHWGAVERCDYPYKQRVDSSKWNLNLFNC